MYIYLLKLDDEVVYVGKTNNVERRIKEHKDKVFNHYTYKRCSEGQSSLLEDELIMKYDPIYNKSLNSKGEYKSLKLFCEENGMDINKARRIYETTPYLKPLFNENFQPYILNSLKAIYQG